MIVRCVVLFVCMIMWRVVLFVCMIVWCMVLFMFVRLSDVWYCSCLYDRVMCGTVHVCMIE